MTANINIQSSPGLAVPHPSKALTPEPDDKSVKAENEQKVSSVSPNQTLKPAKESKEFQESIEDAVEQLNNYIQPSNKNLRFNVDDESGRTIVTIIDSETDEVIRQFPEEEALRISRNLQQAIKEDPESNDLLLIKLEA